jgi:methylated-DNA-protein-cysteine methyltransferase related protein
MKLDRETAIRQTIRSIPRGRVSTYGEVAKAAGYPGYHRQVAQILSKSALDQRMRLEMEGVRFRGSRVDMAAHQAHFIGGSKAPRRRT